jgi:cell shape-determining protein MreC
VNNPNEYRKQPLRNAQEESKKIEALILEVESLSEQNQKLRDELTLSEELMQNLFSYIETNSSTKA